MECFLPLSLMGGGVGVECVKNPVGSGSRGKTKLRSGLKLIKKVWTLALELVNQFSSAPCIEKDWFWLRMTRTVSARAPVVQNIEKMNSCFRDGKSVCCRLAKSVSSDTFFVASAPEEIKVLASWPIKCNKMFLLLIQS